MSEDNKETPSSEEKEALEGALMVFNAIKSMAEQMGPNKALFLHYLDKIAGRMEVLRGRKKSERAKPPYRQWEFTDPSKSSFERIRFTNSYLAGEEGNVIGWDVLHQSDSNIKGLIVSNIFLSPAGLTIFQYNIPNVEAIKELDKYPHKFIVINGDKHATFKGNEKQASKVLVQEGLIHFVEPQ